MCYNVYSGSGLLTTPKEKLWPALWFSLFIILASTSTVYLQIIPAEVSMVNLLLCSALLLISLNADRICGILFVSVSDVSIQYYAEDRDQMIVIPVKDITGISSKFCRLFVHTQESIHSINLLYVKREKSRWELKEMIKQVVQN